MLVAACESLQLSQAYSLQQVQLHRSLPRQGPKMFGKPSLRHRAFWAQRPLAGPLFNNQYPGQILHDNIFRTGINLVLYSKPHKRSDRLWLVVV